MAMNRRQFSALAASTLLTGVSNAADPLPGQTKNTKFAVNVEMWWSKEKEFTKRLENAAALGFKAVEFWPWRNKNIPAVIETCKKHDITITQFTAWGFTPGLNDPKNHSKFLEEIEASCETAKKLDCKMMTVVGGNDIKDVSQEKMHENIIEGLKKAAPIAEKHGIMLILEPMNIKVDHKGHCLYGSVPSIKIIRAVNSPKVFQKIPLSYIHVVKIPVEFNLRTVDRPDDFY